MHVGGQSRLRQLDRKTKFEKTKGMQHGHTQSFVYIDLSLLERDTRLELATLSLGS